MKHKYTITVEAPYVKVDTEKLMREIARRNRAEFLGSRKLKSGDYQCGLSCTDTAFEKIKTAVLHTNNGNCIFTDHGEDDGKRKTNPAAIPAPEPKPTPPPQAERRNIAHAIPPLTEQFGKWDDIGSPSHERAIALLGKGCENRAMRMWGKFEIDEDCLINLFFQKLGDDKWFKKEMESSRLVLREFAPYYRPKWETLRKCLRKIFSEDDAKFIEWHYSHNGTKPDDKNKRGGK